MRASHRSAVVVLLLVVATFLVYANGFHGPFVFDDHLSVLNNPSIRHLGALGQVLSPPGDGSPVGGRPILNLTFALNHAVGGTDVPGYHLVNVLIHLAAGLLLFGVTRRTLVRTGGPAGTVTEALRAHAVPFAGVVAFLFLMHPLQTESVTYVSQRAESLVSLWYLATLYAFIRAVDAWPSRGWAGTAILCALLGMASKEVMVTAPVVIFLYDWVFVSGSAREAWRRHRALHLGLGATWLLLALLVLGGGRGTTAGFGTGAELAYLRTQAYAVVHYFGLFLWPDPLVFDYGRAYRQEVGRLVLSVGVLIGVAGAIAWAARRRPALAFLGGAVLLVLSPSSSIVPVLTQTMAEHRMYLAVAALGLLGMLALWRVLGPRAIAAGIVWGCLLAVCTVRRNADYRSALDLWQATVRDMPENPRARHNLGRALAGAGRVEEGLASLRTAIQLDSTYLGAYIDMGSVLWGAGRGEEASTYFRRAVELDPARNDARFDYAVVLVGRGELEEGAMQFLEVAQRDPAFPDVHSAVGETLIRMGRLSAAIPAYQRAVAARPDSLDLEITLGRLLIHDQRYAEAAEHFERVLAHAPGLAEIHNELGKALAHTGRREEAVAEFLRALAIDSSFDEARHNLELMRVQ